MGHGPSTTELSKDTEKYQQHKHRRRVIEGCAVCGFEIGPGAELMVCSARLDRWTLCMSCYGNPDNRPTTPMYKETVYWEVDSTDVLSECTSASAALAATLGVYKDRQCIGFATGLYARYPEGEDGVKDYQWLSYEEVLEHAKSLGVGLRCLISHGVEDGCHTCILPAGVILPDQQKAHVQQDQCQTDADHQQKCTPTVLLFAPACVEWYLMQYACILHGLLVVPVLDGTPRHQVEKIIEICCPQVIITSQNLYDDVIFMLYSSGKELSRLSRRSVPVILLSPANKPPYPYCNTERERVSSNDPLLLYCLDILALAHGCHRTDEIAMSSCVQRNDTPRMLIPTSGSTGDPKLIIVTDAMMLRQFKVPSFGVRTVMYSFQPLRQSFDTLIKGGCIGLWSGNLGALHEDMRVLRPTHFASTPVFWIAQLQKFNAELREEMNETILTDPMISYNIRSTLVEKWKDKRLLGNRCQYIVVGGAPSSEELRSWIWDVFGCHVADGYGTSETGALATNNEVTETTSLHLIDVPDMGYLTSDVPNPRGEIVAFTKRMTPGYYNDMTANAEAFINIGDKKYFRTGDIGMICDGKLTVIDRKSALFKLPNGVYVAPAPLETLFAQSPLIKQALVYGASSRRSVSVVVVLTDLGIDACTYEEEGVLKMDVGVILKECGKLAMETGRKEYEIPHHAVLSTEEWTVGNGCLTSSLKPCRPILLKKFAEKFSLPTVETPPVDENSTTLCQRLLQESVGLSAGLVQVLRETIPVFASNDIVLPSGDISLYNLGVDSLALAMLQSSLMSRFGIEIPLTQLSGTKLHDLDTAILGGGVASLPDLECGPVTLQAEADAICNSWTEVEEVTKVDTITGRTGDVKIGKVVLLTGVTGFVGAFLLDQLVHCEDIGHVQCLIRAESAAIARERLAEALQRYRLKCNPNRWSIIVGDLTKPKFGITDEEWTGMLRSVNTVYHAGAIVNASLSFESIHAANVMGTKTVVEFCISAHAFLHHVSSISVLGSSQITVETFIVPPPSKCASAYAKSKWLAEQIVGHAVKKHELKARIYRLGTMACHSQTGACNPNDTFTRIVEGIIELQAYTDNESSPLPKGFCLAPIDWAVQVICAVASDDAGDLSEEQSKNETTKYDDRETVQVVHILSNQFLHMTRVFPVITKYGLPLSKLSLSEFRRRLVSMTENNAMFPFRDILKGPGFGNRNHSLEISCCRTMGLDLPCPNVGEEMLINMLKYLHPKE